jgi:hypothetical protein
MLELDDDTTESLETIYDHVVQERDRLCRRLVHRGEEAEETLGTPAEGLGDRVGHDRRDLAGTFPDRRSELELLDSPGLGNSRSCLRRLPWYWKYVAIYHQSSNPSRVSEAPATSWFLHSKRS